MLIYVCQLILNCWIPKRKSPYQYRNGIRIRYLSPNLYAKPIDQEKAYQGVDCKSTNIIVIDFKS